MENSKLENKTAALLGGQDPLPGSNPARKLAPTRHTPQLATLAKPPKVIKGRFHRETRHGQLATSDCLKWQYLALGRWNARLRLTDRQKPALYLTQAIYAAFGIKKKILAILRPNLITICSKPVWAGVAANGQRAEHNALRADSYC